VLLDDIDSFPVILTNESDENTRFAFSFQWNVTGSFQYIKFVIGSNSGRYRYFFGTNKYSDVCIIISDCVFSSEISIEKNWIYIVVELGTCIVKNSLLLNVIYYIYYYFNVFFY
jgi:hypothetical protein